MISKPNQFIQPFCFSECGTTFVSPNIVSSVRIFGGIKASENSWPSQVYIVQRYKEMYYLNGEFVQVKITDSCSGTIIDSLTVLTAAHCIRKNSFSYFYKDKEYNLMFKTNSEYPTLESMYTVYLGLNDISNYSDFTNLVSRSVSRIIRVRKLRID